MSVNRSGMKPRARVLQCLSFAVAAMVLLAPVQEAAAEKFRAFKLENLAGETIELEDLQDKATLIAFFFPTCPYCNEAFPETVQIYEKYKDQGLSMVWINLVEEEVDLIPEWLAAHQYDVPVLVGASMQYLAQRYDLRVTPEHLIIDADREVLFRQRGYEEGYGAELEANVRQALNLD